MAFTNHMATAVASPLILQRVGRLLSRQPIRAWGGLATGLGIALRTDVTTLRPWPFGEQETEDDGFVFERSMTVLVAKTRGWRGFESSLTWAP